MPWQTAPSLIIIGGAFNVGAGLMWGAQRLGFGEDKAICQDEWIFAMNGRDKNVNEYKNLMRQAAAQAEK
eukprot:CAMPEP_0194073330 /NCGR_PEP_ID=MMETSP0149-20130528/801_1 /TAXON_ID=122233 /ORGANISM="Chaetoceros debilis, Strain MM31A-1" /LENGTH=69 /DNA_ID=CAMNT_0038753337 /DNA_START=79 /DNA_END=288 /DNA_ORIENTATION=-